MVNKHDRTADERVVRLRPPVDGWVASEGILVRHPADVPRVRTQRRRRDPDVLSCSRHPKRVSSPGRFVRVLLRVVEFLVGECCARQARPLFGLESLPHIHWMASALDPHRVERRRHGRHPSRTQDVAAYDVG